MHQSPSMSFLIHESAEEYHAKAKQYLSSHQLADFRKCPQLYYRKKTQPRTQEESPAYSVGRAAHVLILEGLERFREDFAVGGPINARTGYWSIVRNASRRNFSLAWFSLVVIDVAPCFQT